MPILNMIAQGGGSSPLPFIHLEAISNLQVVPGLGNATITWTDPGNQVVDGQTIVSWISTKLVRKIGSAPNSSSDGVLVVNETVKDTYSSIGYTDTGLLSDGTEYFYAAFAIGDNGTEKISNIEYIIPDGQYHPSEKTVCYFPLESDFVDITSNQYTLTGNNGAVIGNLNGVDCLDLTASNSYLSGAVNGLPQGDNVRTNMVWVYGGSSGQRPVWQYGIGSIGRADVLFSINDIIWSQYGGVLASSTSALGAWHHVAVVIKGTGSAGQELYVDGVLVDNRALQINTSGTTLYLGRCTWDGTYLDGYISNFIIENKIWTAQEILDYYNQTKGDYGIN